MSGKKHKIKTDEIKPTSTFENLFGSPILNSKNSPDPKLSNSSSNKLVPIASSGSKIPSQKPAKERPPEKSGKEKREKKDKSGNTPKEPSTKKSDEKHERREEKRKEKSSTKDRERSKEKSSKRPPSPKPTSRSPKRSASPPRASSSNSNRHESAKYEEKTSSSSGKKSKKEKRDKSKERDRTAGDKTKESKHQMQQAKHKDEKLSSKPMEKINGSSKKDEIELKERDKSNKYRQFDTKPPSPVDMPTKIPATTDTKKSHDKDERKHKHKKKDKNKDKDRKKSKSKDISDSSPMSTTSNRKRSNALTPTQQANRIPNAKANAMPNATIPHTNQLSEKSSSEFDDDDFMDRTSPKPDKVSSSNDTNQSMDHLNDRIPEIVTPRSNQTDSPSKKHADKSSGKKSKEPKSNQSSASKEEKKRKRKNKSDKQKHDADGGGSLGKRKTQSPIGSDEPPNKFHKKTDDEKIPKIKDDNLLDTNKLLPGRTPPVPHLIASPSTQKLLYHQSPDSSKQVNLKRSADTHLNNPSKLAHRPPATTSSSSPSSSDDESPKRKPTTIESPPINEKYIAQLKALQQKIQNIQDNDELQQVVEMIVATGCYEVNNRTFDFDLCALDRSTVQRLQERLG